MPSEAELLTLARQFDSRGLAQIYDRFSSDLYRYAMRLHGHPASAEECVAETFHRFLQALASGSGPREYLRAYLYRVAHNWITDQYRRPASEAELPERMAGPDDGPEVSAEQRIQSDCLRAAIWFLTPEQRQVIALKFWEGWENKEIACAIGKPVGAVKSLQHRALATLKRQLKEEMA